jgi:AraC-like DNA-binding protein
MKAQPAEIGETRQPGAPDRTKLLPQGFQASRGVLAHAPGAAPPDVLRWAPPAGLHACVAYAWRVAWDLSGQPAHTQETAPHPNAYLVLDEGKLQVSGVSRKRFVRVLADKGWAFGVKFRPGGMRVFVQRTMAELTDKVFPVEEIFGVDAAALREEMLRTEAPEALANIAFRFLEGRVGTVDARVEQANALVDLILATPAITSVEHLARRSGENVRGLQRLFREFVGVTPKWVIRRYRLHELLARLQSGEELQWAALAQELGYFDQAHLIRDFKALVGRTPEEYRRATLSPKM